MMNSNAYQFSEAQIPAQRNYLLSVKPNLQYVFINTDFFSDYLFDVDGIALDYRGHSYTIQFKARQLGHNDVLIPAVKVNSAECKKHDGGFYYNGVKYKFYLQADMYVISCGNNHYFYEQAEIEAIERIYSDELAKAIIGTWEKTKTNPDERQLIYFYISPSKLNTLRSKLFNRSITVA